MERYRMIPHIGITARRLALAGTLVAALLLIALLHPSPSPAVETDLYDFGDAPDSYGTTLANNGARHGTGSGVLLGSSVDVESDAHPSAGADGDDLNGSDDEDGITFTSTLTPGKWATFRVVTPTLSCLDAWIDYNGDGIFAHPAEHLWGGGIRQVFGDYPDCFVVPPDAKLGLTYARFRISSQCYLDPNGYSPEGEVEDYVVEIEEVAVSVGGTVEPTDLTDQGVTFEASSNADSKVALWAGLASVMALAIGGSVLLLRRRSFGK